MYRTRQASTIEYFCVLCKYSNIVVFTFKTSCMSLAKFIQRSPGGNLDVVITITTIKVYNHIVVFQNCWL